MPSEIDHLKDIPARCDGIAEICANEPRVLLAYAFGSRISGRPQPGSDLDIGIVLEPGQDALSVLCDIESQLPEDLPFEVDLLDLGGTSIIFQHSIIVNGQRIYESSPEARVRYETRILALADDEIYDLELRRKLLVKRAKEGTFGGRPHPPDDPG